MRLHPKPLARILLKQDMARDGDSTQSHLVADGTVALFISYDAWRPVEKKPRLAAGAC